MIVQDDWSFERSSGNAGYRNAKTGEWLPEDDYLNLLDNNQFKCQKCGKRSSLAPPLPELPICQDCCEDHEYEYEPMERDKFCVHCGKRVDPDYYYEE